MRITVPNFFSIDDLTSKDLYNLDEGFCIEVIRQKRSGRHYNQIWIDGDKYKFLDYIGLPNWWEKYTPDKSIMGKFFGRWKLKN